MAMSWRYVSALDFNSLWSWVPWKCWNSHDTLEVSYPFFFKSKPLIRSHKLPRSQETVISPCCQLLMGSKGIFFFSKHPYYQISMFPHQFGCLQTPTGWPPIYISLHTTRNTHPTGEMSSVWEDCLSLPPASSDTSDESYISDLVTNWTPPGSVIGCSSSPNLETIYSYHLLYRLCECHMNCHMKRYLAQDPQGSHVQALLPTWSWECLILLSPIVRTFMTIPVCTHDWWSPWLLGSFPFQKSTEVAECSNSLSTWSAALATSPSPGAS